MIALNIKHLIQNNMLVYSRQKLTKKKLHREFLLEYGIVQHTYKLFVNVHQGTCTIS